jgi:prophage regulatory protein
MSPDVLPIRTAATELPAAAAPLVADAAALAILLTLSVRTIRTLDAAGKIPAPIRLGGRVVWLLDEIRAWLAAGAPDRKTWQARREAARK